MRKNLSNTPDRWKHEDESGQAMALKTVIKLRGGRSLSGKETDFLKNSGRETNHSLKTLMMSKRQMMTPTGKGADQAVEMVMGGSSPSGDLMFGLQMILGR